MTPTPLQRVLAAIPPLLVLAFAISMVADLGITVWQNRVDGYTDTDAIRTAYARIGLLSTALWIATNVMVALAMHEVARRVVPGDRALVIAAAVLLWIVTARSLSTLYLGYGGHHAPETWQTWSMWGKRVSLFAWLGVGVLLVVAMRRRPPAVVALLALALLVTTLMAHPLQSMRDWFYFDRWEGRTLWRNSALGFAYGAGQWLAFLAVVAQLGDGAPPAPADPHRVAAGIGRVGAGLVARIVVAMGFALVMMMAVGAKSPGLFKASLVLVPTALLIATLAMITGLFQAGADAGAPRPPRYRFGFAAACMLTNLVMVSVQALAAYRLVRNLTGDRDDFERESLTMVVAAFPYLGPAIALAGMIALVSALASLRHQRGAGLSSADPATAGALIAACSIAAALAQYGAARRGLDSGGYLMLIVLASVASIVGQLAVARLCQQVADGLLLDLPTGLPPARVHNPEA